MAKFLNDEVLDNEAGGEAEETDRKEFGVPRIVTLSSGRRIDTHRGTIPQNSHFICGRCGKNRTRANR